MRYYSAIPSKFACATSNHSNKHPFCVPVPLMERQGAVSIFHAKQVILEMSVYSLVIARERLVFGMPSPLLKIKNIQCKQTPPESCWYGGHPRIWLAMACVRWWRGSKLYFTTWEPPLICLAWKILKTLGRDVDRKSTPPKIIFHL